jgi:ferredoxin
MENELNIEEIAIEFKKEGISGSVPAGTYLIDAAKRLGVRFPIPCIPVSGEHYCSVDVENGIGALSDTTEAEKEFFVGSTAAFGNRLACQARLERPGSIIVETRFEETEPDEKKTEGNELFEGYKERFSTLSLEQKMSEISQLEALALADTLGFVMNAPYVVGNKVTDILADIGLKKDIPNYQEKEDKKKAADEPSV